MTETQVAVVRCGNDGHLDEMDELPAAVARVSWPSGRFKPTTACQDCLETLLQDYVLDDEMDGRRVSVLIAQVDDPEPAVLARNLVRAVEDGVHAQPAGWDDNPVHGKPDDPKWAAHREHTCGKCGKTFGSNFQPGEVDCPECEARLCSSCGHWDGGNV